MHAQPSACVRAADWFTLPLAGPAVACLSRSPVRCAHHRQLGATASPLLHHQHCPVRRVDAEDDVGVADVQVHEGEAGPCAVC